MYSLQQHDFEAFRDNRFSNYQSIELNRGCGPLPITEREFNQVAIGADYSAWQGHNTDGHPFLARLIDPLAFVQKTGGGLDLEISVLLAIARDAQGRFWSLAVADDESAGSVLRRLAQI